ncbi:hypothetical protein B566_EDAN001469 [Ephemera danica]|nr:hypothetical protein B566_EDAN001469 [Ephemera danica]
MKMSGQDLSHFDEKSGVIQAKTCWGRWWQTVHEICIEIDLPPNTRAKNCSITIKPSYIECVIQGNTVIKGGLYGVVRADENVWSIEGGVLNILLSRSDHAVKEAVWTSLLKDGTYQMDPLTLNETRKKLDLERFQLEHPGFDFSRAKLAKCYDKVPQPVDDEELLNLQASKEVEEKS